MLKKLFLPLIAICALGLSLVASQPTYAEDQFRQGGSCPSFLGLTSWDCGVNNINDEDTLKNGIWKIVLNISNDISIVAAYLILAYIIYGGYLYIFSGGDTGKVATGKKALNQAFIGMAIVMSANLIVGAFRAAFVDGGSLNPDADANALITGTIQWIIGVAGVVAVIFIVGGGLMYITSAGDPSKLQKAKNTILYALIGLIIVILSEIISGFISSTIRNANNTSYINTTSISYSIKEANEK